MWIVTDDATGAIVAGPSETESPAAAGQTVRRVPIQTRWDTSRRTFVDAPREFELRRFLTELLTPMEFLTLRQWAPTGTPTPDDLTFMWAREIILTLPRINLDDPNTVAVLQMCVLRGLLTQSRAEQILAGLPVL